MEEKIVVVKHIANEGPGVIGPFFKERGWQIDTVDLSKGDVLPEELRSIGAVVVLGGPMNVYEEKKYSFLKDEDAFIRKALIEEVPILGVCLGAQLLAKTCGAAVKKAPHKEIGWYKVRKTPEGKRDSLFRGVSESIHVFQWHGDTFDVPENGMLLAEGKGCRNQAFRVGQNGYGVQFHLEITEEMIRDWFASGEEKAHLDGFLHDLEKVRDDFESQRDQFLVNFLRIAESSLRFRRVIKDFMEDRAKQIKKRNLLWWNAAERTFYP